MKECSISKIDASSIVGCYFQRIRNGEIPLEDPDINSGWLAAMIDYKEGLIADFMLVKDIARTYED